LLESYFPEDLSRNTAFIKFYKNFDPVLEYIKLNSNFWVIFILCVFNEKKKKLIINYLVFF